MKTKLFLIICGFLWTGTLLQGQDKDYVWSYQGKKKTNEIGLWAGLSGSYSEIMGKSAGYAGVKLGATLNHRWGIGVAAHGLLYDYRLSEVVTDGTYHLEGGYSGLMIEYYIPVGQRFKINLSVLSGQGIVKYKYDKDFAEERPWYQETIDEETFAVFEPGIEIIARLSRKWWVGAHATYRNTSPIKLMGNDEDFMNNFNTGITFRYGLL